MGDQAAPAGVVSNAQDGKPAVLIIGGLGYIGRFLAHYIHTNSLASTLRIVDKQLPQLASLAPEHREACSQNFVQADASREQSQSRIFDLPDTTTSSSSQSSQRRQFDYVFNCGGETRYSQEDQVYKLRSYELSLAVGREAAKRNVQAFIEVSTASVYNPTRSPPAREGDKTSKPHGRLAKWKLAAEEALAGIPGLRLCVLRLPHVYGPYNTSWLGTQLALARVYQSREPREIMKWLWSPELRTNTLHVDDAAAALWAAAGWRAGLPPPSSSSAPSSSQSSSTDRNAVTFNVVDRGATSQSKMAGLIRDVFGIETGFQNALVNTFAKLNLEHVVDDVNDDVLDDWAELLEQTGVRSGDGGGLPLSPFMEKEVLRDADLSINGEKFEQVVGWKPKHESITKEEIEAVIESYRRMNWWP